MPHPLMPTDPPISTQDVQTSFIGEVPQLQGKIEVVPYNPQWPAQFEAEAAAIRRILGNEVLELEHVGSTSVPGLPAKPIRTLIWSCPTPRRKALMFQRWKPQATSSRFANHIGTSIGC